CERVAPATEPTFLDIQWSDINGGSCSDNHPRVQERTGMLVETADPTVLSSLSAGIIRGSADFLLQWPSHESPCLLIMNFPPLSLSLFPSLPLVDRIGHRNRYTPGVSAARCV